MEMWNLAADLGLRVVERRGTHRKLDTTPATTRSTPTPARRGRVPRSASPTKSGTTYPGHRPTDFGPIRKRQEHAANTWAARALITPDAYAAADHRDGHLPSMAFDLNVSDELAIIYRNSLLRTEQATYVAPKMGAGQFAHRLATG